MRKRKKHFFTLLAVSPVSRNRKRLFIALIFFFAILSGFMNVYWPNQPQPLQLQSNVVNAPSTYKATAQKQVFGTNQEIVSQSQVQEINIGQQHVQAQSSMPTDVPEPAGWGVATQISPHTWTVKVGQDPVNATPVQIFAALNVYRQAHEVNLLSWDNTLASFAQSRATYYVTLGKLDGHVGFMHFVNDENGFTKLGYSGLGENASYGFILTGVHLIEWVYAADPEHNANQLNSQWTNVGIGVSGTATDIVFGGGK